MNILQLVKNCQVEWKPLGEVARKVSSGGTPKSNIDEYYNGNIAWLRTQEVNFNEIWDTGVKITESGLKNSSAKWIPENCIIVAMYGATVGRIAINKIPLTTNQACANIELDENILDYRFVYHYLASKYEYIKSLGTGSQTNINAQIVKNLIIPIPPLEIQQKIVQILDAFTATTAELTAEYNLRVKQYQYYRDLLLDFDNLNNPFAKGVDVEWKTLGEIVPLQRGKRLIKNQLNENGQFAVFQNSLQPLGYYNKANCRAYMTFIISAGAAGEIGFSHKSFWAADDCYYFDCPKDFLNDRFLYYFLMTQKHKLTSQVRKASVPRLGRGIIEKINIPIPPIETQAQIVAILDKFDTLINSISEGLPREIELRQKQYEYYRELLLGFE